MNECRRLGELIEELQRIHKEHGDIEVVVQDRRDEGVHEFDVEVNETLYWPRHLEFQFGSIDEYEED